MAIYRREFHHGEDATERESWLYLCRDTERHDIHVQYQRCGRNGMQTIETYTIEAFLSEHTAAGTKLRKLIGTLVTDGHND